MRLTSIEETLFYIHPNTGPIPEHRAHPKNKPSPQPRLRARKRLHAPQIVRPEIQPAPSLDPALPHPARIPSTDPVLALPVQQLPALAPALLQEGEQGVQDAADVLLLAKKKGVAQPQPVRPVAPDVHRVAEDRACDEARVLAAEAEFGGRGRAELEVVAGVAGAGVEQAEVLEERRVSG